MRLLLAAFLVLHGLIHLMGFAKAFGYAQLPQLVLPISRMMGALWLTAALLLLAAAVALFAAPRFFWALGALGLLASQIVIISAWSDARYGAALNLIALIAVLYGAFAWGPFGLRAEYQRLVRAGLARLTPAAPITDADLAALPEPVARYLRLVGVVGRPRIHGLRVRLTGRIRAAADAPWMPFTAEQHSFFAPPRRFFWMEATRARLPIDGLHVYDEGGASMRVKLLSLIPVVDQSGPAMTAAETVTLLNDMCVFAPAALIDPAIRWRQIDPHSVEATYTHGPHTVRAVLFFDDAGALINFWSDDRPALAPDGVTLLPQRWSTPIGEYRVQGPYRLASRGEARYAAPTGDYAYIEFDGLEVTEIDPTRPHAAP